MARQMIGKVALGAALALLLGAAPARASDWSTDDHGASAKTWYIEMKRVRKYTRIAMERGWPVPPELVEQRKALGDRLIDIMRSQRVAECTAIYAAVSQAQDAYAAGDTVTPIGTIRAVDDRMEPCLAAMRGEAPAPAQPEAVKADAPKPAEPWRTDIRAWLEELRKLRQPIRVAVADGGSIDPSAAAQARSLWAAITHIADTSPKKDFEFCFDAIKMVRQVINEPTDRAEDKLEYLETAMAQCRRETLGK